MLSQNFRPPVTAKRRRAAPKSAEKMTQEDHRVSQVEVVCPVFGQTKMVGNWIIHQFTYHSCITAQKNGHTNGHIIYHYLGRI